MNIETGTKHEVTAVVTDEITAAKVGSGSLAVLATPYMVALMEQAASELCDKYTEEGISTVGTALNIQHLAATAVGAKVKAVATVTSCDGRKVTFDVEAYDNAGLIGKGTHERFSIKIDKFMLKAEERKNITAE
ncbi:MAG: thioesterase family protein [Clostridia bacterium]|nr:thioesterase family protein [Clostridia bacterium]